MKKQVFKLLGKIALLAIPVVTVILFYFVTDPFKVLYHYDSYFTDGKPSYITLNKDFVSTETFLNNYPIYKYDSFIFGNSRSVFYQCDHWKKYINSDNCFHDDASGESLYGIYKKILFLDKHSEIKNALIIMDYLTLYETEDSDAHLYRKHPEISGRNRFLFHLEFLKTFFSNDFLIAYFDFKLSGQVKKYMKEKQLIDDISFSYNLKYNEIKYPVWDEMIKNHPSEFYTSERINKFYDRDSIQTFSPVVIEGKQEKMMREMDDIFKKHNTLVKIIINPLYDQEKLNPADLVMLKNIFGEGNVFDFSGINGFTNDYHNYYETSHYRPHIADSVMKTAYSAR